MTDHPLWQKLREQIWEREPATATERQLMQIQRYIVVLARDLMDGELSMRAMSLVYTTLLSLVPLLALGFSLFKALGIHNALEPVLLNLLSPLGPQGTEIAASIVRFVENIKVGVLGSLGLGLLFYTVVSMLQKIERSFNFVWRIESGRRLGQRVGEYLSVIVVGPVLVFSALGITASFLNSSVLLRLASIEPFGVLIYMLGTLVPYLLIIAAFTFLYAFIPNTQVKIRAALAGGVLGGFLWQTGSAAFAAFVAGATNYNAIYSGFAILIFLLIWLYLGWLILLVGCQLSYYVQHPERLSPTRAAPHLSGRLTELLGLQIFGFVGRRFLAGAPGPTIEELRRSVPATPEHVDRVVEILIHRGLLIESSDEQRLLPKRDLDSIPLSELVGQLRLGFDSNGIFRSRDALARDALELVDAVDQAIRATAGNRSVRDWLGSGSEKGPKSPG